MAEAGAVLRFGTYRSAQAAAARNRMLQAWGAVDERQPDAGTWIRKAGLEHHAEHLPPQP